MLNPELCSNVDLFDVHWLPSAFGQTKAQLLFTSDSVLNIVMNYFYLFSAMFPFIASFRQVIVTGLIYNDA